MAVNESLMSRVTMQHVVKYNKQKGCASLPFIPLDTGVEALNLNESHPIENSIKALNLLCNLKKKKTQKTTPNISFTPNQTGTKLHQD